VHLVNISAWFPKLSTDPTELAGIVVKEATDLKITVSNYLSSFFAGDEGIVHLSAQNI